MMMMNGRYMMMMMMMTLNSFRLITNEMVLRQDYQPVFPEGKAAGTWLWPPSMTEVKERVELYI